MPISIGIDLGTTYSLAAYVNPETGKPEIIPNPEGRNITPSVIRFINGEAVFGSEAEEAFTEGLSGCAAAYKRNMGTDEIYRISDGREYTPEELSSMLLKYIRDYVEAETGQRVRDAVITVPAYFYAKEREAVIRASELAGLKVRKIIDEPNAAALAYGLNHWRENANILVYDLGGGTFDVTLIHMKGSGELETITTRGDHYLGGKDWDNRLEGILITKFSSETGINLRDNYEALGLIRGMTEGIKKKLSRIDTLNITAEIPGYGRSEVTITRSEFEAETSDLLRRTGDFCLSVLSEAAYEVNDIDDVLLVGGSTRMPAVSDYLSGIFGKKPIDRVNPDEAVALGAAIQAMKENESYTMLSIIEEGGRKSVLREKSSEPVMPERKLSGISDISLRETTAHALGMIALSHDGKRYINEIIIPENHPRPVKASKDFSFATSKDFPAIMEIYITQGSNINPLDNQIPFRYTVTGIEHKLGNSIITVQYSYDKNGIIHIEAYQDNSSVSLNVQRDKVPDDMSRFSRPPVSTKSDDELNIVMALDVSGSMLGKAMRDARKSMIEFIERLNFNCVKVSVLAVSDSTEILCGLTDNIDECINAVKSLKCGQTGFKNTAHPFDAISEILSGHEGRKFAIILADGVWESRNAAVKAAKRCIRSGIETAAIGFGYADAKFLHDISSNDSNAVFVDSSEHIGLAFGTIARSLGS